MKNQDSSQVSHANLQGVAAELEGDLCSSLQQRPNNEKEQAAKLREEWDSAVRDVAVLRAELEDACKQRDRFLAEANKSRAADIATLEAQINDNAILETRLSMQQNLFASVRKVLAALAAAEGLADAHRAEIAELEAEVERLQGSLADSQRRLDEDNKLIRRMLQELVRQSKADA
ncbi:hypothetical protein PLESTF_001269500 [Pleodorina starrii]|nr:hypothetical protein PLESTF_001269500 [Pleodorina starrii]